MLSFYIFLTTQKYTQLIKDLYNAFLRHPCLVQLNRPHKMTSKLKCIRRNGFVLFRGIPKYGIRVYLGKSVIEMERCVK